MVPKKCTKFSKCNQPRGVLGVAVLVDYAYREKLSSLTLYPNTPISIAIYNSAPS